MTIWLRTRHARTLVVVTAGLVSVIVVLGNLLVPMPAIFGVQGLALPVALLAPVAGSVVLGYGLAAGDATLESIAVRPIRLLDTGYAIGAATATLLACSLVQAMGWSELGYAAGRNALGYAGLLLIGRHFIGANASALLPATAALVIAFFGADFSGSPRSWAWIVLPSTDQRSWLLALGLLAAGVALSAGPWRAMTR